MCSTTRQELVKRLLPPAAHLSPITLMVQQQQQQQQQQHQGSEGCIIMYQQQQPGVLWVTPKPLNEAHLTQKAGRNGDNYPIRRNYKESWEKECEYSLEHGEDEVAVVVFIAADNCS
jgi:hypothetical protein